MSKVQKAEIIFNDNALAYQNKFMEVDTYAGTFATFCAAVQLKNAAILELGCGPGNITKNLLSQRPDFNILGTDLAPAMIELAKTNNPTAQFKLFDCRKIRDCKTQFDAIMCGFCLPYLSKEESIGLLNDSCMVLKENGVIYISTMEGDYSKSGPKGPSSGKGPFVYTYYHEADYLLETLKKNNFSIIECRRFEISGEKGTVQDLVIIAQKDCQ